MDNNKQTNLDSIKNLERNTELRQKELHLKKWEEELKLKEKLINENDKDRTKLLSYVTKFENRNHELFLHIQTLQTRIEQVELHPTHTNHQTHE
jgi:chromosome segregation ATPase